MNQAYIQQVNLLLRILPEINKIDDFALHGGTAINLFYHNMPRLSVDIDLTYIPFNDREKDLRDIGVLLENLSARLKRIIPGISIKSSHPEKDEVKLFCRLTNSEVKIEVNTINRGLMDDPQIMTLCNAAQQKFNSWCEMKIVPIGQLFGGKIVAALDRQHPRDIFDIKKLLEKGNLDPHIIKGLLFCLFSSKRPIDEILKPNMLEYNQLIENQFSGMTQDNFTPSDYHVVRNRLNNDILNLLNEDQKSMILSFCETNLEWIYEDWSKYPGIAWKLRNLKKLKRINPDKFNKHINTIKAILR
jgi:predicted nucleotidyltransferase component of viral defense system